MSEVTVDSKKKSRGEGRKWSVDYGGGGEETADYLCSRKRSVWEMCMPACVVMYVCVCVCIHMDCIIAELFLLWNLAQHYTVVAPHLFEISTLFRIHSPKSRGSRLKCITIENKSKSSIWKSSETMQPEPKSGGCAILLLGVQSVASFSPPSSSSSTYSLSGPGPGRYSLPPTVGYINHDFTKPRSAAYTFHSRMSSASKLSIIYVCSGKLALSGPIVD